MLGLSKLKTSIAGLMQGKGFATVLYNYFSTLQRTRYNRERALENTVVNTCMLTITQAIATLPIHVKEDSKDGAKNINNLFKNPNPWQSGERFIAHIVNDLLTEGNAYIWVKRLGGTTGRIVNFVPLLARYVEVGASMGYPIYTEALTESYHGRQKRTYSYNQIIHISDFLSPGVIAKSRIEACWSSIDALNSANLRTKNIFDKGVNISYVGKSDGADDNKLAAQVDAFNQKFNDKTGSTPGGLAVLSGVEVTPVKGATPVESSLLELRQDLTREISSIFGVPPFLAGGEGDTKYSNTTARIVSMYKLGFEPILILIKNGFSSHLGHEVVFDDEKLLLGDLQSIVKMLVEASGGPILTPNEAREKYPKSLPPTEGGDELRMITGMPAEDPDESDQPTDDGQTPPEDLEDAA